MIRPQIVRLMEPIAKVKGVIACLGIRHFGVEERSSGVRIDFPIYPTPPNGSSLVG